MTYSIVRKCKLCSLPFPAEDDDETACESCWDKAIAQIELISLKSVTETVQ